LRHRKALFDPSHRGYYAIFTPIDGNNVTIASITPYIAAQGSVSRHFRYYLGWRRDEISFDNRDLLGGTEFPSKLFGVNAPKATLSFLAGDSHTAPQLAVSFGEAFFTDDPRIGNVGFGAIISAEPPGQSRIGGAAND
jgi:hypothetical protein